LLPFATKLCDDVVANIERMNLLRRRARSGWNGRNGQAALQLAEVESNAGHVAARVDLSARLDATKACPENNVFATKM